MIEKKDDFCVDSDNGNRWACNFFTQEKEILETYADKGRMEEIREFLRLTDSYQQFHEWYTQAQIPCKAVVTQENTWIIKRFVTGGDVYFHVASVQEDGERVFTEDYTAYTTEPKDLINVKSWN